MADCYCFWGRHVNHGICKHYCCKCWSHNLCVWNMSLIYLNRRTSSATATSQADKSAPKAPTSPKILNPTSTLSSHATPPTATPVLVHAHHHRLCHPTTPTSVVLPNHNDEPSSVWECLYASRKSASLELKIQRLCPNYLRGVRRWIQIYKDHLRQCILRWMVVWVGPSMLLARYIALLRTLPGFQDIMWSNDDPMEESWMMWLWRFGSADSRVNIPFLSWQELEFMGFCDKGLVHVVFTIPV